MKEIKLACFKAIPSHTLDDESGEIIKYSVEERIKEARKLFEFVNEDN